MNASLTPIVSLVNGRPVVSSLKVAEHFKRRHDNVVRDIRRVASEVTPDFAALNFEESQYVAANRKRLPMFQLTRDGFTIVAMGYTGADAMRLKEAYIRRFNEMERALLKQCPPQPAPIALSPDQCRQLHNIMDAKMSALHPDSRRAGYAEGWTRFNRHFKIAKYEQLPPARFSEALDYLIGLSLKVRSALPAPAIAVPHALPALPDDLRERLKAHASKCLDFTGEVCTRARQLMCEGSRLSYEVASHIDPLFQHTPSGYLNRTRVYDAMTTFSSNGIKAIEAGTDNIYLTARMMEGLAGMR